MSLERAGREYGDGRLLSDDWNEIADLDPAEQAMRLGWSVACPVVLRLIESRGAEAMEYRYGEILFWFGVVAQNLEDRGFPDIRRELESPVRREAGEPWGERDEGWVPNELKTTMFGPASPEGYALPRLITTFLGNTSFDGGGVEGRSNRIVEVLDQIDKAIDEIDESRDLEHDERVTLYGCEYRLTEFVVIVADLLVRAGEKHDIPPAEFFHQLLGTGKLNEDNCRRRFGNIVDVMHDIAPDLYEKYVTLTKEEIEVHHVAVARVDF